MKGAHVWLFAAASLALLFSACGDSGPVESAEIRLESPGVNAKGITLPNSECGYGTIWLPLKWDEVPEDASELVLYIGQFRRERQEGPGRIVVPYASIVTGISSTRRGIAVNTIPDEAEPDSFNPTNSCPSDKRGQNFLFRLFAVDPEREVNPRSLTGSAVTQLTEEALGSRRPAVRSPWTDRLTEETLASGGFTVKYGRGR